MKPDYYQIEIKIPKAHYWCGMVEFVEVLTSCRTLVSYVLILN